MAMLGAVYSIDPYVRTPDEIVEALFRQPSKSSKDDGEKSARPRPQHKRLRASINSVICGWLDSLLESYTTMMGGELGLSQADTQGFSRLPESMRLGVALRARESKTVEKNDRRAENEGPHSGTNCFSWDSQRRTLFRRFESRFPGARMYDEDTIVRATKGDELAISRILFAHDNQLRKHIACRLPKRLLRRITVEDVMQETHLKVIDCFASFEGKTVPSVTSWLITVANNQLTSMVRKQLAQRRGGNLHQQEQTNKHPMVNPVEDVPNKGNDTPYRLARRVEVTHTVRGLLEKLPSEWETAIKLRHLEGQSVQQIAAKMNSSEGAVRGYLHRAKKQLRVWLGRSSKWFSSR